MTKKRPERPEKQDRTALDADMIDSRAEEIADLAKRLSSVAQKMRTRGLPVIESMGWKNLELAIRKINGPIGSVERAYLRSSTDSVVSKVAEKQAEYDRQLPEDNSAGQ